jgi:hypothetical protein
VIGVVRCGYRVAEMQKGISADIPFLCFCFVAGWVVK